MDNGSERDNIVTEVAANPKLTNGCLSSEMERIAFLIPIFCDLYSESYNAKFIADMMTRQYLLESSIEDITDLIREYYKTGKIEQ